MFQPRRYLAAYSGCLLVLALGSSACAPESPDITGIWSQTRGDWPVDDTPYTAAGRAVQDAWNPDEDPVLNCIVHFGRVISAPYPVEILQNGGQIAFLYENAHQVRRIFMDGRGHPENEPTTVIGHSIGHWEGSTLVGDTAGINAGYLRPEGLPHTSDISVTGRYTPVGDGNTMEVKLTIDDSAYYRESFVVTREMGRSPDNEILEYNCVVRDYLYKKSSQVLE